MAQRDIIEVLQKNSNKHMTAEEMALELGVDSRVIIMGLGKLYPSILERELIEGTRRRGLLKFRWWIT